MKVVRTTALGLAGAIIVVVFGAGVPFAWVWIGSQLQGGTAPSLTGLGVTLLGIIVSYVLLAIILAWVKDLLGGTPQGPVRHDWNRSLSAERRVAGRDTHPIEDFVAAATIIVGVICTGWFVLFGDPGVPVAPTLMPPEGGLAGGLR